MFPPGSTLSSFFKSSFALGTGNTLTILAAVSLSDDLVNGFHSDGRLMSYTASAASHDYDNAGSFALARDGSTSTMKFTRNSVSLSNSFGYNTPRRLIFTLKSDGTKTLYLDGVAVATAAGTVANFVSPGYFSIGSSEFDSGFFGGSFAGTIGEIGIATGYHDASAVGALDEYLKNKWGL
jgi:hypothetical protein